MKKSKTKRQGSEGPPKGGYKPKPKNVQKSKHGITEVYHKPDTRSPLSQDPKFDTTAHDYGRRAHTMTAEERKNFRTGVGHALTFTPVGGVLGIAGKAAGVAGKAAGIIKSNIGASKPVFSIGQGLVRGFGTKGMKKTYDKVFTPSVSQQTTKPGAFGRALESFSNMPKQYSTKPAVKVSGMNRPVAKPKSTDPYTFSPKQLKRVQGMNTPLKPNLTPKNPRGVETIEWAGGRKVVKPGTPGRGGRPTYSEKNPLWPTFEGTNMDKILYPRNWK